jgi:hypothetical protein
MGQRFALFLIMAGALLSAGADRASASTTHTDTVNGSEVAYTSTQGTFTGYATGDLPGSWAAVIHHTVLSPDASITGGSFTLATVIHWIPRTVDGTFAAGGTVTRFYREPGCGIQRYAVEDDLVNVGVAGGGSGSGHVSATLTHYRHSVLGHCVAYAATIAGTVRLTF